MSVPVTITIDQLQQGWCWTGGPDFITTLATLIHGNVSGSFSGVIISATEPAPGDRDKLWVRLNADLTPERAYIYLGTWRWPNPRPPSSGERIIWTLSEASLWSYDGGSGQDPVANPPTDTTGAMWMRDTAFGTDDGTNCFRFPVGIGKNSVAYDGNPAKVVGVGDQVGVERVALDATQTPAHQHFIANVDTTTGTLLDNTGYLPRVKSQSPAGSDDYTLQRTATVPTVGLTSSIGGSLSHPNLPPGLGVIFARRTARKDYTPS